MEIYSNKNTERYTIIVGCGRLGANLANTLSDNGESVLVIDKKPEAFRKLSPSFGGLTLTGDGTDMSVLTEAEIKTATAVISVTNRDNTNIFISQIAREYFNVPHVIARLYDWERECVYQEFKIDTICPAVLSFKEIEKILNASESKEESV